MENRKNAGKSARDGPVADIRCDAGGHPEGRDFHESQEEIPVEKGSPAETKKMEVPAEAKIGRDPRSGL